jgi:hypothetical protein
MQRDWGVTPRYHNREGHDFQSCRKTRRSIRVIRFGKPLAEIVPLSPAKNEAAAKKFRKTMPRTSKAYLGR